MYGLRQGIWTKDIEKYPPGKSYLVDHLGYQGKICRHPSLFTLCGYIDIPLTDAVFKNVNTNDKEINLTDIVEEYLDFHHEVTGGSGLCIRNNQKVYNVGFDCAHYTDIFPAKIDSLYDIPFTKDAQYRDYTYVENKIKSTALRLFNKNKH